MKTEHRGPTTAAQHALVALRRAIVAGEVKPREKVVQEAVADDLGISLAPVREALRVLEQEGQVVYQPRRGYFVAELNAADLTEIYALRQILEERAARAALPTLDDEALARIEDAAEACVAAASEGDVSAQLAANRQFHFAILDSPDHVHTMRMIRLLWDSTEPYRAMYYSSAAERAHVFAAHDRIIGAVHRRDPEELVGQLDAHRDRALSVLLGVLAEGGGRTASGPRVEARGAHDSAPPNTPRPRGGP